MNQNAEQKSAVYPREEDAAMLSQEETLKAEIAAKDKRAAAVFWWILMACRLVIPLYVAYAIYLYWTLPVAVRYSGGGY